MKKLTEMTDIGFKRAMTKIQRQEDLVKKTAKILRCKPEDILERMQKLFADIEKLEADIQKVKDKI